MSKIRQERTAEEIRLIMSDLLHRDVSDPRLMDLTVTRVLIDRELQHANIYVNALGDESRKVEVMKALEKAGGYFRYELAQRMNLRTVPELHFHWDPTLAYAQEVDEILNQLDIPSEEESDRESER
ncbi:MAG: 30S ribosome-binding factor RbfA [Candidatus Promineifilaceae bacterium]|nr:30S ribosome-binding factor RbfA [Candidatus Promineifilaceae bacterium]